MAGRPAVADLADEGGELTPRLRSALYKAIPKVQARRVEARLLGRSFEEIGHHENTSKQAIQQSVARAHERLGKDAGFVRALCDCFPDAAITPSMLQEAARGRQAG